MIANDVVLARRACEWLTAESGELIARWYEMELPFSVMRSARRTPRIVVSPDGSVAAHVPKEATDEQIVARVSRRGGWIKRELIRYEKWRPQTPARQYLSDETHLFRREQYRLVVTSESAPAVRLDGDRIVLAVRENSDFVLAAG